MVGKWWENVGENVGGGNVGKTVEKWPENGGKMREMVGK